MSPDELLAESYKYSNRVAIVLKLESGRWAVFNAQRRLLCVTPSLETVALAIESVETSIESLKKPLRQPKSSLTLDDLGL